jgi:hypothetical protein
METLIGFVLGVIGTYLFWRFQVHLKPKIKISKIMAKDHHVEPQKISFSRRPLGGIDPQNMSI